MAGSMRADGVLLSGFGGPDCPDAVGPFMRNLTGREPESDVVERVRARYERIGGCSPLRETAVTLGGLVEAILADAGTPVPVAVGMRYWHPTIEEAVTSLASSGAQCIAHVSLSPLESAVTHARYREAIDAAARASDVRVCETASLSALPAYRRAHAEALQAALDVLSGARVMVVFTAHSLPVTASGMDETYVSQFRSLCDDVASMVGLGAGAEMVFADGVAWGNLAAKVPWVACYQSRGARGDKW
ncbi:MAG: ferrochelatase, partial [Coriobacteriia bacterium]|nr:ferrochelatase [Coriobacteriia bacterium]